MIKYQIKITDLDGNEQGEFENFKSLYFDHVLNREGSCKFKVRLSDNKLNTSMIQLGKREVHIYRENTKVWGGNIILLQGALSKNNDDVTIYAKGFFDLFKTRYTGALREFSSTDAGAIAWTLIDESQSLTDGDFSITESDIDTSVDRDRTYQYKNIYDAIIQLSEVKNGFDFEITAAKEFKVHYPHRGDDLSDSQVLEWGKNIEKISRFELDFSEPANQITVLGSGQGEAMNTATRTNTTMRSAYKLRQLIYPYKDVEGISFLEAKGDELLIKKAHVRSEYEVVQKAESYPTYGILQIGDWIRIKVSYNLLELFDVVKIRKQGVYVNGGKEVMVYNFQYN